MILYIDETENDECFIVAGILANADLEVESAYRRFKKSIKSMRIEDKYRSQVYTEFKSTLLDRRYKRIKIKMLEAIVEIEPTIVYSVYKKKVSKMNQVQKEAIYITLLTSILTHLENATTIVFDRFGKPDFEKTSCLWPILFQILKVSIPKIRKSSTDCNLRIISAAW